VRRLMERHPIERAVQSFAAKKVASPKRIISHSSYSWGAPFRTEPKPGSHTRILNHCGRALLPNMPNVIGLGGDRT
jgi:hypothetical protein